MMKIWTPLLLASVSIAAAETATVHFKRVAEPREGAFTLLLPSDWRLSGGILRVNPMTSGGALNATAAKLEMTAASPDGRVTVRWLPEMMYVDGRRMPAAGLFPQGSNYNGALVWPLLDAFSYLDQGVFRRQHTRASAVTVKGRYPLPKVAESYRQLLRASGVPIDMQYSAGLLVLSYREGAGAWEEALYTAVQDFGPAGVGLWCNKDTLTVRAPAGELEKTGPVVATILNSIELNPRWVEGEIRGQIQRNEIALRNQQDIARLDREIVEHRRRTNAEINNQMYHTLMGTEEYVNPLTKKVEVGSNSWSHRWVNERGEAIYTDDPNYDPRQHGLDGFHRSPARKRFPDR